MSSSSLEAPGNGRVYTRALGLLFAAELAMFAGFYFVLATTPLYLLSIGGSESSVGVLTAAGTASVLLSAPLAGRGADRWGRRVMLRVGALIAGVGMAGVGFAPAVAAVGLPLVACYVGFNAYQTASRALAFDLLPASRRGEGIASFLVAPNLAIAVAPAAGLFVWHEAGAPYPFVAGGALCVVALVLGTLGARSSHAAPAPRAGAQPWIVREALLPASMQLLLAMSYMSSIAFLPVVGEQRGMAGYAWFFPAYSAAVISVRLVAGRISDRFGRAAVLVPALASQAAAVLIVSGAHSATALIVAAVAFGTGWGAAHPTLTAVVADRVEPTRRGAGLGVLAAASSAGSTLGIAFVGFVGDAAGFERAFQGTASMAALAAVVAALGLRPRSGARYDRAREERP